MYFRFFKFRKPIFLYYRPSLVSESLACLESSTFFQDFYHSFRMPSLCRVTPKITMKSKFVIFPSSFSVLCGCLVRRCVTEKRTDNIYRMPNQSLMLAIKGAPTDHDTQTCCQDHASSYVSICLFFFIGCTLLLTDPGVV